MKTTNEIALLLLLGLLLVGFLIWAGAKIVIAD